MKNMSQYFLIDGWRGVVFLYTVMILTGAVTVGIAQFGGGVLGP